MNRLVLRSLHLETTNKMKIVIILGTRPEIIKLSPIIREFVRNKTDFTLIHTNQHYSAEMDKIFFDELKLPQPNYNLQVGSGTHGMQTGKMLKRIEKVLLEEKPSIVLVEGDTNTVLAGALAAAKLKIKVGHVEAGLRSFDKNMPEELNRVLTDHLSDYCFAPTEIAKANLLKENIPKEKIFVTGNTIVDAVLMCKELAEYKVDIFKKFGLKKNNYMIITAHRPENVNVYERLCNMLKGLRFVREKYNVPMIWPIHPRTSKMLNKFNLSVPEGVKLIAPLSYLEFLQLQANSKVILTDSGGIQEEACILNIPCVTMRDNTERPETINIESNILVGVNPKKIVDGVDKMLLRNTAWENPFGDGKASQRILEIIKFYLTQ